MVVIDAEENEVSPKSSEATFAISLHSDPTRKPTGPILP